MTGKSNERASRIEALAFDYAAQPKDRVASCNLCGAARFVVVAHHDRYGYAAEARGCLRCGLVFLDPRLTADGYGAFYRGIYRPLVSAYHGRVIDARTIQAEQRAYASERAEFVADFLPATSRSGRILDIGGSTGVVAAHFAACFGMGATIIDPAPAEVSAASELGLETITGFVEDWDPGSQRFELVLMCQTVDHLLDARTTLQRVAGLLAPDGRFFVDIVDFRAAYLRQGSVADAVKIDHPYYLTEATMQAYLARAGLEVLGVDYAADHLHVGYVCRQGEPDPGALPAADVTAAQWAEIRAVQNRPR